MGLPDLTIKECTRKLLVARMNLLCKNPFYGLLLMHVKFSLSDMCATACTDGMSIYFNPEFLKELEVSEVEFIMMHEILHIVLKHCLRREYRNNCIFNVACDIVVNSNILYSNGMDKMSISLKDYGVSMHLTPDGKEGYAYTAEQVYEMLIKKSSGNELDWDDHTRWGEIENAETDELWTKWFNDAYEAVRSRKSETGTNIGILPPCAERMLGNFLKPQVDWRELLHNFIQQEINDYSFNPPDKRYLDSGFFLPDFNDTEEVVRNVLFWIDTSASMSDKMVLRAYSEVKGAIDQYGGKLSGMLGFFDTRIYEPQPFMSEEEFLKIKPKGRGGTNYDIIFEYVQREMRDNQPCCMVILTDGGAKMTDESVADGISTLWFVIEYK